MIKLNTQQANKINRKSYALWIMQLNYTRPDGSQGSETVEQSGKFADVVKFCKSYLRDWVNAKSGEIVVMP